MARLARVVIPGFPYHITQRGNRRQQTFFIEEDYESYIDEMARSCRAHNLEIWSYCLMPNHVHMIAVPNSDEGLRLAIGEAHRRYTRMINFRQEWRGHLWQGRFASYLMDETHLLVAARYVELNPVRAGLARTPWDYPWSSAGAHVFGKDDRLVKAAPLLDMTGDWKRFLMQELPETQISDLRRHERTGRPMGSEQFIVKLEELSGIALRLQKPGPKAKTRGN